MTRLANELKLYQLSHKLTQTELTEKLGVSQSFVSTRESGSRKPSEETLNFISKKLELDTELREVHLFAKFLIWRKNHD